MGNPLFAAHALFASLQRFARWLASGTAASAPPREPARSAAAGQCSAAPVLSQARRQPARLRVVRVFEGSQPAAGAGRIVISGRMADVCAELERLAALEAAAAG